VGRRLPATQIRRCQSIVSALLVERRRLPVGEIDELLPRWLDIRNHDLHREPGVVCRRLGRQRPEFVLPRSDQHERVDDIVAGDIPAIVVVECGLVTALPASEMVIEDPEPGGSARWLPFRLGDRIAVVERGKTAFGWLSTISTVGEASRSNRSTAAIFGVIFHACLESPESRLARCSSVARSYVVSSPASVTYSTTARQGTGNTDRPRAPRYSRARLSQALGSSVGSPIGMSTSTRSAAAWSATTAAKSSYRSLRSSPDSACHTANQPLAQPSTPTTYSSESVIESRLSPTVTTTAVAVATGSRVFLWPAVPRRV
jgi:hypothetical protein